jgi:hypothetical protein
MPGWIEWVARFNPVHWGAVSAREAMLGDTDWARTGLYLTLLLGATGAMAAFGTWAFRIYRRTL